MLDAFGEMIPLAVASGLAVGPMIAIIALLGSKGGGAKGVAIWLGWFVTQTGLVLAAVAVGSGRDFSENSDPSRVVGIILLVLGAGILWLGTQQWRSRPKGDAEPEDPAWLRGLDAFSLPKTFLTGLVLSVANSKNLPMAVGAGTIIARADLGMGSALLVALGFAILSSVLLAVPIVIYFALGDRAQPMLDAMRLWLRHNGNIVMTVVLVIIGALLVGEGLKAF